MRVVASAAVVCFLGICVTSAQAMHLKKHVVIAPEGAPSEAIPKDVKAVCKSKVLKIKTEKWVELRRRERCYV